MIEFDDWARAGNFGDAPWLVLGKGPTFADRRRLDLDRWTTVGLNHVVAEQRVDVAHFIDFDVAEDVGDALVHNAKWVLLPRHPHIAFEAALLRIDDLLAYSPALAEVERQGRLVVYDLETGITRGRMRPVPVRYFSSEAVFELLGRMGVGTVHSLGIDGGRAYAGDFEALAEVTRLANGQPSFSLQFPELQRIAAEHRMEWIQLSPPLRVFVGVQEEELIAAKVLEYTIHMHATTPVQVVHLPAVTRKPRDEANQQRTNFSFSRFLIPELCGYEGRAIYCDSDMQVFADISQLWDIPMDDAKVLCTRQDDIPEQWRNNAWFHPGRQLSVMMLDCSRLPWKIDEIIDGLDEHRYRYDELMFELCILDDSEIQDRLPAGWNHLEHFEPGETSLLHYTVVPTQPWRAEGNPLREIWLEAFVGACQAGYIDRQLVEDHVRKGYVHKSLARLVPRTAAVPRVSHSAMAAELDATRQALALRGGPLGRAAIRVALERMRQSKTWRAPARTRRR